MKVPVAVTVLKQVDAGQLRLADSLPLQEADRTDGPRQLVWSAAGSRYTVDSLLTRMLHTSDNTAANVLIRRVGVDRLNAVSAPLLGAGFGGLSDMAAVRYAVYGQIHPDARRLPNRQIVEIAAAPMGPQRVEAVRRAVGVAPDALQVRSIDEACDAYYRSGQNSATLEGYGGLLEQLVRGQLLSPATTRRLFTAMKCDLPRGDYRLEGGLPTSIRLIHKTGTQYRRACHMAVVNPQNQGAQAIVVATCAADLDEQRQAGPIFRRVGEAVTRTLLTP